MHICCWRAIYAFNARDDKFSATASEGGSATAAVLLILKWSSLRILPLLDLSYRFKLALTTLFSYYSFSLMRNCSREFCCASWIQRFRFSRFAFWDFSTGLAILIRWWVVSLTFLRAVVTAWPVAWHPSLARSMELMYCVLWETTSLISGDCWYLWRNMSLLLVVIFGWIVYCYKMRKFFAFLLGSSLRISCDFKSIFCVGLFSDIYAVWKFYFLAFHPTLLSSSVQSSMLVIALRFSSWSPWLKCFESLCISLLESSITETFFLSLSMFSVFV